MFLGEYYTNFTGQGRVILPKRFRQELGKSKTVILSRGFEKCVWGFAQQVWEKEAEKQLQVPITDPSARDLRRYLFSAAQSTILDEQGRFIIPKTLLEYAGLREGVAVIGAGDHFEIWDASAWKKYIAQLSEKI